MVPGVAAGAANAIDKHSRKNVISNLRFPGHIRLEFWE
jgi:hypothetical protein